MELRVEEFKLLFALKFKCRRPGAGPGAQAAAATRACRKDAAATRDFKLVTGSNYTSYWQQLYRSASLTGRDCRPSQS